MASKRTLRTAPNKDGKLTLRRSVAHARMPVAGFTKLQNTLMLSVYIECFKYVKSDDEKCWAEGARMHVPRTTTEKDQMLYLDAMTYTVGLRYNRDFDILVEASPKKPKECEDGIQRPFACR